MTKEEIRQELLSCVNDAERQKRFRYLQNELHPDNCDGDSSSFKLLLTVWEELRTKQDLSVSTSSHSLVPVKTEKKANKKKPKSKPRQVSTVCRNWANVPGFQKTYFFRFVKDNNPKYGYSLSMANKISSIKWHYIDAEVVKRGGYYDRELKAWYLPTWPDIGLATALNSQ